MDDDYEVEMTRGGPTMMTQKEYFTARAQEAELTQIVENWPADIPLHPQVVEASQLLQVSRARLLLVELEAAVLGFRKVEVSR